MVRESELERIKAKALERKAQTKKEARQAHKQEAKFRAVFDSIDQNRGGSLDIHEMVEFMSVICPQITEPEVHEVFSETGTALLTIEPWQIDVDGDGDLTFQEFMNWVENPDKMAAMSNAFLRDAIQVVEIPDDELVDAVRSSTETGCKLIVMSLKRWKKWGTEACTAAFRSLVDNWRATKVNSTATAGAATTKSSQSPAKVNKVPRLQVNTMRTTPVRNASSGAARSCGGKGVNCCLRHDKMRGMVLISFNKTLRRRKDVARAAIWRMVDAMREQS